MVDGSGLIDQSADCPEAEARHGQTGMGLSRWLIRVGGIEVGDIEVGDRGGWSKCID